MAVEAKTVVDESWNASEKLFLSLQKFSKVIRQITSQGVGQKFMERMPSEGADGVDFLRTTGENCRRHELTQ